jgi:hypothetical protein
MQWKYLLSQSKQRRVLHPKILPIRFTLVSATVLILAGLNLRRMVCV